MLIDYEKELNKKAFTVLGIILFLAQSMRYM